MRGYFKALFHPFEVGFRRCCFQCFRVGNQVPRRSSEVYCGLRSSFCGNVVLSLLGRIAPVPIRNGATMGPGDAGSRIVEMELTGGHLCLLEYSWASPANPFGTAQSKYIFTGTYRWNCYMVNRLGINVQFSQGKS